MNKILCAIAIPTLLFSVAVHAQVDEQKETSDELYMGSEIKPLEKDLSDAERQQENNETFDSYTPRQNADLACDNEKLLPQVENFIYQKINAQETSSVAQKRERLLLVRNMNAFAEVDEHNINADKHFMTAAILTSLKINQKRKVSKICRSTHNRSAKFGEIDVIIYPFAQYYKVVVTNLVPAVEKMDEGTFIFNW